MKALLLILGFLFSVNASAAGGVAFKCMGEASKFEIVQGWYAGESTDIIYLKTSAPFGIFNKNPGEPLPLAREQKSRKGAFADYLTFSVRQKDDLGTRTSVIGIPLGTFGRGAGKAFQALLKTDRLQKLDCETVDRVDL